MCPLRKDVIGLSLRRSHLLRRCFVGRSMVSGDGSVILKMKTSEEVVRKFRSCRPVARLIPA